MSEENKADERIHKLSRPFTFEEKTYAELNIDFDKLTGDDLILAETAFKADNPQRGIDYVKETSKAYLAYVVAAAAGVHPDLIKQLPAKDFCSLTLRAQNFLLF